MAALSGFPYFEVEFTKEGTISDPGQAAALSQGAGPGSGVTDLIVISHGWNNDMADARALYAKFFASLRSVLDRARPPAVAGRTFAIMAVLWPSKKFAEEELIPSGAAALGSAVSAAFVEQQVGRFAEALASPEKSAAIARVRALVAALPNSPAAQEEFANLVRSLLSAGDAQPEDASTDFFQQSGKDLMDRLSKPTLVGRPGTTTSGGAAAIGPLTMPATGVAAGLGDTLSGALSGARNLLNYATYYLMKARADTVGRGGVNGLLRQLKATRPDLRLHLIGHSFGARLVTAAADGPASQSALAFDTMTLLQAAFSHNAFAEKFDGSRDGGFRSVVTSRKVRGPILVTHSLHDRAVGVAYPLASRLAGQDASALGDADDRFGGLGRNGAQHTPERVAGVLQPVGSAYALGGGKVFNLNADQIIQDHSDICHEEVAFALLTGIGSA